MVVLLKKFYNGYQFIMETAGADPRTQDWPLVAKPAHGLCILGLYLMFVLKWGPRWMKNRPAYNVDKAMIVYNFIQVVLCTYVFIEALWYAWGWNNNFACSVDYSNDYKAIRAAEAVYHYYLLKYLDLFDTVFFILRKKFNQASFLHLFHHFNTVIMGWVAITFLPGGHGSFISVINSFVHIVMYFYYFLTISVPSVNNSAWWKKHITQLQIVQLAWVAIHMLSLPFKEDCNYPRITVALLVPSNIFMLILFLDFYIKSYVKKPEDKKEKIATDSQTTNGRVSNKNEVFEVSKEDEIFFQKSVLSHRVTASRTEK
ncbi:very long chain fatty acid elongase 7-like isoform X2 [Epargyreus clarus]|uniref:very long chain fatty acid elongase 7-like isoform X2 n=1 Tax=Epargyreus clarus TaxID=520877 RepID=UPI003C2AB2DF